MTTSAGRGLFWLVMGYLAWLRWGTRSNPPVPYDKYKTGLTFSGVRELLDREAESAYRAGQYMFISCATVLGRMHELKQGQYERYLDAYYAGAQDDDDELESVGRAREAGDLF